MIAYSEQREEILLQLVKEDDYQAFEELYARHFDLLIGYAYNVTRDKHVAKDIIQEIFTWFWSNRSLWKLTTCKGYLLTAVKYKAVSYFRSCKAQDVFFQQIRSIPSKYQDDSLYFEAKQLKELIESLVETLPDRCKEVFKLSRLEYYSNKEIAKKMGISEKTVEAQMTIALKRLKGSLGNCYFLLFFLI
ncbi:RNA polymerase sigma-70 factor [Sphingobacterium paucimobilis]|uniref:HTH luxR-type domain-containing protein n=1 Tax=Sphingobacterium paucimobilis HER1398 TaxID=1346330 RepID=U2J880_9SPHI|nr:RNA polymerase sigma-70 factor [Sphingobacterium paucimobilis]ERJ58873.1 hypothetical protein M472_08830 [Sphingobacterium paucimobilis HER1398]